MFASKSPVIVGARQAVRPDGRADALFRGAQTLRPTQNSHQLASTYK
jgi:hypothetical protein